MWKTQKPVLRCRILPAPPRVRGAGVGAGSACAVRGIAPSGFKPSTITLASANASTLLLFIKASPAAFLPARTPLSFITLLLFVEVGTAVCPFVRKPLAFNALLLLIKVGTGFCPLVRELLPFMGMFLVVVALLRAALGECFVRINPPR